MEDIVSWSHAPVEVLYSMDHCRATKKRNPHCCVEY
jgi:hypothetical protein